MTARLGNREVGATARCYVVGEVASAHQGDPAEASKLARAAVEAGADAVKFQLFVADELIAPIDSRYPTFRQIEIGPRQWERILGEAVQAGLTMLADIFDRPSLAVGEKNGVSGYKIHSTDMENPEFIRAVAATGKPVLLSTGGSALKTVEAAMAAASAEGNEQIILLHGVQNFPTRVGDSHLRYIQTLKRRFGVPVGFLDHVDAGTLMARLLPALAVAFGADLVEKHITLNRDAKGFDYESSLEPEPFREMVGLIRQAEEAFGSEEGSMGEAAHQYHQLMRRAVVSREALHKGIPLRAEQLALVRNEKGLAPLHLPRLLGRKPRRDISAWEPLTEELFE
ncbi:MAG TPA: N-acetylneuraminate synthase family protein [Vicinamibacteria bacterium]|nr:N-acetylneuraminate synthase family protein [Vicinamibacteria bacterium]